jgi:hypothetical protein
LGNIEGITFRDRKSDYIRSFLKVIITNLQIDRGRLSGDNQFKAIESISIGKLR